jgi:hypothetical protein
MLKTAGKSEAKPEPKAKPLICTSRARHPVPFVLPPNQNFVVLSRYRGEEPAAMPVASDEYELGAIAQPHTTEFGKMPAPMPALALPDAIVPLSYTTAGIPYPVPSDMFVGLLSCELTATNPRLQITFLDKHTHEVAAPERIPKYGKWYYAYTARFNMWHSLKSTFSASRQPLISPLPPPKPITEAQPDPFIQEVYERIDQHIAQLVSDSAKDPLLLDVLKGDRKTIANHLCHYIIRAAHQATEKLPQKEKE